MKVIFLQDDFPPQSFGGAGFSTCELAKGVQEAGHDVSVITTCRKKEDAGETSYNGLRVFRIQSDYHERWRAWRSLYNPPVVRRAEELLRALRPDVVHANNIHYHLSYYCLPLAKKYAKRVIITFRDAMAVSYGKLATPRYLRELNPHIPWFDNLRQARLRYNPFRNVLIKYFLRFADRKCSVSDALRRILEQNGIAGVETIHTGINIEEWQAPQSSIEYFKRRYGIEDKKIILFGGRLGAGAQVVRAAGLVARKERDVVFVVMGREAGAMRMKGVNTELPIVFAGWLSGADKVAAYGASDVVWVPSTYFDAFPRSALEAMAAGKPVVATRFGGAPELVVDCETGYIVNPLIQSEIADKTLALLTDPDKATAMGETGRKRVGKEFNFKAYITTYLRTYQNQYQQNTR